MDSCHLQVLHSDFEGNDDLLNQYAELGDVEKAELCYEKLPPATKGVLRTRFRMNVGAKIPSVGSVRAGRSR